MPARRCPRLCTRSSWATPPNRSHISCMHEGQPAILRAAPARTRDRGLAVARPHADRADLLAIDAWNARVRSGGPRTLPFRSSVSHEPSANCSQCDIAGPTCTQTSRLRLSAIFQHVPSGHADDRHKHARNVCRDACRPAYYVARLVASGRTDAHELARHHYALLLPAILVVRRGRARYGSGQKESSLGLANAGYRPLCAFGSSVCRTAIRASRSRSRRGHKVGHQPLFLDDRLQHLSNRMDTAAQASETNRIPGDVRRWKLSP